MERKFNSRDIARIKRTAQNISEYVVKKERLQSQMTDLQAQIDQLQAMIDLESASTKTWTGGWGPEDLVKRVVVPTDKVDKNGKIIKNTKFELIYPDTIIPPTEDAVSESEDEVSSSETEE